MLDAFQRYPLFFSFSFFFFFFFFSFFAVVLTNYLLCFCGCLFPVSVGYAEITFPKGEDSLLYVLGYFLLACINRSNNTSALKFQQLRALYHFKEKGGTVF